TGLSIFDHALGAGFGFLRGLLVSIAIVMGTMAFSRADQPPRAIVESRLAPYVVDAAHVVASMAPYDLKEGFRKTYGQVKAAWNHALEKGIHTPGEKRKEDRKIGGVRGWFVERRSSPRRGNQFVGAQHDSRGVEREGK